VTQISLFAERLELPAIDLHDAATLLALWTVDPFLAVSDLSPLPWFWLGCTEPHWLWEGNARGPLLITVARMEARWPKGARPCRGTPRRATVPVFLDSGAYSELDKHGRWTRTLAQFIAAVRRSCAALETVRWVGIQDWMCEPWILAKTGLSLAEHQRRTVASYLDLRAAAPEVPWLATLQGFTLADYLACAEAYARAGVDLAALPLVGLGSVCRRSGTAELVGILDGLARELPGVLFHGYGVKSEGVLQSCAGLRSVDSDAWSSRGRHAEGDLRRALGLPVDAPSEALAAISAESLNRIDADLTDFHAWKMLHFRTGVQNSQEFAEYWRSRQLLALAARVAGAGVDADE
jgi:hypothetical protein